MDDELAKFKSALVVFVVFCLSLFKSCEEIKYSLSGKSATGEMQKTFDSTGRRMRPMAGVVYEFRDEDGKRHTCTIKVSPSAASEIQKSEEIIYMPSNPKINQLARTRSWLWPGVTLAFFVVGILVVLNAVKEANEAMGGGKKKKRKR